MKSIEFGSFIKAIRESKTIPQRIVAHKLDIDTSTLSKIELGERQVNIEMIKGLAEVLEIDFNLNSGIRDISVCPCSAAGAY